MIVPLYRLIGVDPAMFGSLLSIDMGGYQLALELAEDPQLGNYAGLVVASIFGCTLVFTCLLYTSPACAGRLQSPPHSQSLGCRRGLWPRWA